MWAHPRVKEVLVLLVPYFMPVCSYIASNGKMTDYVFVDILKEVVVA
jgi:hypothetical protein